MVRRCLRISRLTRRQSMLLVSSMSSLFRAVIAVGVLLVIVSALWSSLYSASPQSSLRLLAKRAVPSLYHDPNDNKTWKVPSKLLIASATDGRFHLNSIAKRIISGEFHYFRTHPAQWDDRLRRLRTAGLNTITTRIPWNIHEKRRGVFEFNGFWNLSQFIQTVHRLGLLLIVDIGPYIDADWEFGGLPYWLLHDADMVVRSSSYPPYMNYVERYMGQLLTVLTRYTYKRHGPIIAVQIENELGSYTTDYDYLETLVRLVRTHGIDELILTADRADHLTESIKVSAGTLKVVTCFDDVKHSIESLRLIQPSLPVLVTVYTAGAVTRWGEPHSQATSLDTFRQTVGSVLQANASINIYGFAGGTNFGFYNGALDNFDSHSVAVDGSQVGAKRMHQHRAHRAKVHGARAGKQFKTVGIGLAYRPVTTSYNYDAAVSETGCVQQSPKYHSFRRLLLDHNLISRLHVVPQNPPDVSLGVVKLDQRLSWQTLVSDRSLLEPPIVLSSPVFMERLNVQYGNGQGYGWILYRTVISGGLHYINVTGILRDRALIYLDSKLVSTVYSDKVGDFSVVLTLHSPPTTGAHGHVLEILVENMGRANFGLLDEQRKGFVGRVLTDGGNSLVDLQWEHFSLDFSQNFIDLVRHAKHSWTTWNKLLAGNSQQQPTLYRGQFKVRQPKDSFLDMSKWTKGLVILNGFILGRYWNIGPQYVLYVPAPLLARGVNDLIVFELERTVNGKVKFVSRPEHHHVMHTKKQV